MYSVWYVLDKATVCYVAPTMHAHKYKSVVIDRHILFSAMQALVPTYQASLRALRLGLHTCGALCHGYLNKHMGLQVVQLY